MKSYKQCMTQKENSMADSKTVTLAGKIFYSISHCKSPELSDLNQDHINQVLVKNNGSLSLN